MRIAGTSLNAFFIRASLVYFALMFTCSVSGIEIAVSSSDAFQCDPLVVPDLVDELGTAITNFPPDSRIDSEAIPVTLDPNCGSGNDAGAHFEIVIENRTDRTFDTLWTVADTGDSWIGNYDGYIEGAPAMRIDSEGTNAPLVYESMIADGLFEPGEVWRFRLYNWLGSPPYLCSPGLVGLNSVNVAPSTFSIVAVEASPDADADGVPDDVDNCIQIANADQFDSNQDDIGSLCDADITGPGGVGDCSVNFQDLQAVKDAFFSTPTSPDWNLDADFDNSGQVNFADLDLVRSQFFGPPGPSAAGCN